jgi:hypothetical protein
MLRDEGESKTNFVVDMKSGWAALESLLTLSDILLTFKVAKAQWFSPVFTFF